MHGASPANAIVSASRRCRAACGVTAVRCTIVYLCGECVGRAWTVRARKAYVLRFAVVTASFSMCFVATSIASVCAGWSSWRPSCRTCTRKLLLRYGEVRATSTADTCVCERINMCEMRWWRRRCPLPALRVRSDLAGEVKPVILALSTAPSRIFLLIYSLLDVSARLVSWVVCSLRFLRVVSANIMRDGFSRGFMLPS